MLEKKSLSSSEQSWKVHLSDGFFAKHLSMCFVSVDPQRTIILEKSSETVGFPVRSAFTFKSYHWYGIISNPFLRIADSVDRYSFS